MVPSQLPVVLPGGQVRAHGVLALLPQDLLDERWLGHMNREDGAEAGLPHGAVAPHALQLEHSEKRMRTLPATRGLTSSSDLLQIQTQSLNDVVLITE